MLQTANATIQTPIAHFADRYGTNLEKLSYQHKLFVVAVLSQRLGLNCLVEDAIDSLDPDALIPTHLCDALLELEPSPQRKLLELMLHCLMTNALRHLSSQVHPSDTPQIHRSIVFPRCKQ